MKRILSCFVFIVFGMTLLQPVCVHAQDSSIPQQAETMMVIQETPENQLETTKTPVEYALPYPGMLPDHPLFFLKRLRDSLMEMLISDPMKKAEFYLLQADKRLAMALAYEEKKQTTSVLSMITEDANYYKKLTGILSEQEKQTVPVPGYLVSKIRSSLQKHIEVMTGFTNRATGQDADRFGSFLQMFSDFGKNVHE